MYTYPLYQFIYFAIHRQADVIQFIFCIYAIQNLIILACPESVIKAHFSAPLMISGFYAHCFGIMINAGGPDVTFTHFSSIDDRYLSYYSKVKTKHFFLSSQ